MSRRPLLRAAALLGAAVALPAAHAQLGWTFTGSNTLRLENYEIKGDPTAGPYAFGGRQFYDEVAFDAFRQLSPYDNVRLQLYGVANDSEYRSRHRGLVPERLNFTRENGESALPYRLEIGDYFSSYSFRTLQRGLKGVQVELQPQTELFGARQSLIVSTGTSQFSWRNLHSHVDDVAGVSWLLDFSPRTRVSANYVYDFRRADAAWGLADRRQHVYSAAGASGWDWGGQRLRVEAEVGQLTGDHNGLPDATGAMVPGSGDDRRGHATFIQFSGFGIAQPIEYRLRYERYDRNYQPANAVIVGAHEAAEAHAGWRFASGLAWRGRAQHFVDALQSGNSLRNNFYGTSLAGPLYGTVAGIMDLFWQDTLKQDMSINRRSANLNGNLSRPLPGGWIGNLGLFLQRLHERVAGADDTKTHQVQLSATHAVALGAWTGSVTPGVRWRRVTGDIGAVKEWAPVLALNLNSGAHLFGASYGGQRLVPLGATTGVVDVNTLSLDYRYVRGQHTLGVQAFAYDRDAQVAQQNRTYRTSVFWTYSFERTATQAAASPATAPFAAAPATAGAPSLALLLELAPASSFERATTRLSEVGIRGGTRTGDGQVFETRLLHDVPQRQRLVLVSSNDSIRRAALLVDFSDPNNAAQVAREYEEVRRAMLDRFGPATLNFEDGAIGPNFAADLNLSRVVRVMQWSTPSGVLRMGIPRRLDGQVRMEIQYAASFGAPRDLLWSVEGVR